MGANKCCAASGLALQVESVAKRNTACKNTLANPMQNQGKCIHERQFAAMNLPQYK